MTELYKNISSPTEKPAKFITRLYEANQDIDPEGACVDYTGRYLAIDRHLDEYKDNPQMQQEVIRNLNVQASTIKYNEEKSIYEELDAMQITDEDIDNICNI